MTTLAVSTLHARPRAVRRFRGGAPAVWEDPRALTTLVHDGLCRVVLVIYLACAAFGDRVGEVGFSADWFRSLHITDILTPVLLVCVLPKLEAIDGVIGPALRRAMLLWLVFSFTLGVSGHILTGLSSRPEALVAAGAFAGKEAEFMGIFALACVTGRDRPRFARGLLLVLGAGLCAWLFKELADPTGIYLVGLPFEAGASQTGAVYSMSCVTILALDRGASGKAKAALLLLAACLAMGCVASASRSGIFGLGAGLVIWGIGGARPLRNTVGITVAVVSLWLLLHVGIGLELSKVAEMRMARSADQLYGRTDKWDTLVAYIVDRPELWLAGAGLGSPNYLVLGPEYGLMLTVDSGYVRRFFETGVLGCLTFFGLLWTILRRATSLGIGGGTRAIFVTLAVNAFSIESFQVSQTALLFYGCVGVLIGLARRDQEHRQPWANTSPVRRARAA